MGYQYIDSMTLLSQANTLMTPMEGEISIAIHTVVAPIGWDWQMHLCIYPTTIIYFSILMVIIREVRSLRFLTPATIIEFFILMIMELATGGVLLKRMSVWSVSECGRGLSVKNRAWVSGMRRLRAPPIMDCLCFSVARALIEPYLWPTLVHIDFD